MALARREVTNDVIVISDFKRLVMKPEQWQQLDKLFHSALEHEPGERAAFLDEACAGDKLLRKKVDALLVAHEEAGSFIERPAMEVEARELATEAGDAESEFAIGESVSHYRISAPLGSGGMGQVYLAQDMALGRNVALKLLPADFTRDKDRVRRFQQEARAASALNHPNIITIHEIGQVDHRHFIATEFIDGQTLRERITRSQSRMAEDGSRTSGMALQVHEVLNLAIQTADALAAAHETGIVHRDIKPENIMVRRRDGYVKVLDFGLAKLTEGAGVQVDSEAPTRTRIQTSAGMVMGTANYMSPEQARGEKVDARTDIWSLGVVLYEMVAGCAPFERATPSEVIALILERQPPPLARYARDVPSELERIVGKALTKDKEERYQTAKDLLVDLRRLRQRLEVEAEIERFAAPGPTSEGTGTTNAAPASVVTTDEPMARTDEMTAQPTSSAEFLVSGIKRHKRAAVIAVTILVMVTAGIAFGLYRLAINHRPKPATLFQTIKMTRLTNTGNATDAAISPDGKYVAYVVNEAGQQSLWVRHISTSSNVQIVPPEAEADYYRPTFSPDGGYVYYLKAKRNELRSVLYQVPVLGGVSPKKIIVDVDGGIAFSPDGKQIAFVRQPIKEESYLMVANADGSEVRTLAARKWPSGFAAIEPAWSPDAKAIFCAITNDTYVSVEKLRVADGAEETFSSQRWSGIWGLSLLRDGGLIVAGDEKLWYLSYPDGQARRITDDSNLYLGASVSEDSSMLVTSQRSGLYVNIWVEPFDKGVGYARQITPKFGFNGLPSWTPDSKIVYTSNASGNMQIWIMDQDGANPRQLTANQGENWCPTLTADGRYIVFGSNRSGADSVWRMDSDGGNPKQLTSGGAEAWPYCSPDGRWVVYVSTVQTNMNTVWKVPLDGGEPVQLTDKYSGAPAISPDGKLVACVYFDDETHPKLAIIPIEGGPPVKMFELPPSAVQLGDLVLSSLRWASDGNAVTYVDTRGGFSNIWSQPLDRRPPKQITDFKSDRIYVFDWSRDGKRLALARGGRVRDVVLISDSTNQQ